MTVFIGTSGWQYRHWRGAFYPPRLPQREWLEHYAARFQTVEVNNTFYNLPRRAVFEDWCVRTPEGFVFALKMSRYLTHLKRLRDPKDPVDRFMEVARGLDGKLGPVLLQLPPRMKADTARLQDALQAFPRAVKLAVEFRDDSWRREDVRQALADRGAALCLADRGEELATADWKTADWGYIRLHWGKASPQSCYTEGRLRAWARRLIETWDEREDVFVFFNNDANACALRDAVALADLVREAGRRVSATPRPEELTVQE